MTFYDIFSKKEEKINIKKIEIDFREKNSLVPSELTKLGFIINFKNLPVADYLIKDIAIERKTAYDLKSSIIDKRIFNQLKELKQYPSHFLIIEGDREKLFDNVFLKNSSLQGFIISVYSEFNVPIIFSQNEKDTAEYIRIISNRSKKEQFSLNPKKISLDKNEQIRYILESFPNIGPKKSKRLIEKFKSLKNIFNADENELTQILGKNTKRFIELSN